VKCKRTLHGDFAGDQIGMPCMECSHVNIVHTDEGCVVCELIELVAEIKRDHRAEAAT
jgi:hypothetical protein